MKKLFALCLASLFLFITPIDAIASIRNDYSDSDICILTQDSFEGLFNSSTIESVSYDYCITIIDTQRADVHLSYVLEISDSLYTGEVSGQVEGITISASDVVWEGPLYGELAINGHVCAVSIGFAKKDSNPNVQLSFTIQCFEDDYDTFVAFSAGTGVITSEIYDVIIAYGAEMGCSTVFTQLSGNHSGEISLNSVFLPDIPETGEGGNGGYSLVGSNTTYAGGRLEYGYACKTRAYFSDDTNSVVVAAQSYCDNVEQLYNFAAYAQTSVDEIAYTLVCNSTSGSNKCNILGINYYDYQVGEEYNLSPLFEDLLSALDIPTSTINAVIEGLSGSAEVTEPYNDRYTFVVDFSAFTNAKCGDGIGLPVEFNLAKANYSEYSGSTSFSATTIITYRTAIVLNQPDVLPGLYYYATPATTVNFEVTLG